MRIAREIIETLKLELGFLKSKSVQLEFKSDVKNESIKFESQFDKLDIVVPFFKDLHASFSLKVDSLVENSQALKVRNTNGNLTLNVNSCHLAQRIAVHESLPKSEFLIKNYEMASYYAKIQSVTPSFDFSALSHNVIGQAKISGYRSVKFPSNIRVEEGKNFPIYLCEYIPSQYVEKAKILDALKALSQKHDISHLKFYAYYKEIPITNVESIKILQNRNIRVYFNSKVALKGYNRNVTFKDVLVFKYDDKYLYHLL
ncbi:MAG: hypothetical protein WHS64_00270 [Fervidobacterium sp.]|uniref:Uncharacterized protein n=1 Tax=Fervidobacterium gondwanense DSM 13020 TaxID=1121883 RepID=A0A1M7S509_FERGO|nr:hypothetical protein [Fervidobacterium gondwanense]UXF00817.1 hypothetical protein IB67_04405 [Fervidobacterium riparium]SHN53531.1 hypothetical protein SAMN02745226_00495 [Fervidobacterium gondwanense DSM 13020]